MKGFLCTCVCQLLSPVLLFATSWTIAHQTLLSIGFSRQDYWSGLACPPPGDLPHPGNETQSPSLHADFFFSQLSKPPGKPSHVCARYIFKYFICVMSPLHYSVQLSYSVVSDSLRPHESQHARPPCPSPTPGVHSDSCPSSQ